MVIPVSYTHLDVYKRQAYTAASKVNNIATQTMPTLGTAAATYCGQNLGAEMCIRDRCYRDHIGRKLEHGGAVICFH